MTSPLGSRLGPFVAGAAGGLALCVLPEAIDALSTPSTPLMWWLARAFGLVAYISLFLSMLFGVFAGARGAGGLLHTPSVVDLHRYWAVAALLATALHVFFVVTNVHAGIDEYDALVPFASERLRGPVALGSIATWGLVVVVLSTAVRRWLPATAWRAIHAMAFGTFALSLVHSVAAGTSTSRLVTVGYVATGTLLLGAILQRLFLAGGGAPRRARSGQPRPGE